MNPRLATLFCLLSTCAYADRITLNNGDAITGSVIKKDSKNLTFKSDIFGTITVPWEKIKALSTDKPVFIVMPGDRTVLGTVETKEDHIEVASTDTRQDCSLADLVAIRNSDEQVAYERLLNPGWTKLWAGSATLGLAGARGNARSSTLTAGFNAARVTSTDKTSVQLNAIRASALADGVSATTAQAIRGGVAYARTIVSRLTWNAFNDYEYDRFQNLDLRFVLGGGLGYKLWKFERSELDLLGGGAYNRESFAQSPDRSAFSRNSGEAYFGDDFAFKLSPVTSLYQNSRFFTNMAEAGQYRANFDLGANTKLTRWLTWNASVSDRYLSRPVVGRKHNDFLYTTGLGVTFSR